MRTSISTDSVLTPEVEAFIKEWHDGSPYIIAHTSGSTGQPKEIHLAKSDMLQSALSTIEFFGLNETSTLLLPLSPDYIAGKMQIVRALAAGCRLVSEQPSSTPFSGKEYAECSLVPLVPSQIEGFLGSPTSLHVKNIIVGGAPMSPEQEGLLAERPFMAFATYGMTETCSHVALRRVGEKEYHALPGVTLTTDSRGCLIINHDGSTWGPVVTTDVVELTGTGSFTWKGRLDNVINSGGVKIHPEAIEKILTRLLPAAVTAYVTSRVSQRWGQEAIIVTDATEDIAESMLESLKPLVPHHHLPKEVIRVSTIERTPTGKIKRMKF